jgi:1-deoxy-D-xylulose-5-phosphate reductoisomerase
MALASSMLVPSSYSRKSVQISEPIRIALFGATGSIGRSTLELVRANPELFQVDILVAHSSCKALLELAREFSPRIIGLAHPAAASELGACGGLPPGVSLVTGPAVADLAADSQINVVVAAIVGAAGVRSVVKALQAGKRVALANKESLVVAGAAIEPLLSKTSAMLIPVDSEHSALFQALQGQLLDSVSKLILTASGGPFLMRPQETFSSITPEEAVRHPRWSMGKKISVDSATMMNKALELIEAHWLFGVAPESIDVVVHPQSIVHSAVEFIDGSVIAQLSHPDMKGPISYALCYPDARVPSALRPLRLAELGQLDFCALDQSKFPAIRLARESLRLGGLAPAILNVANELAVAAFLDRRLGFNEISAFCELALERVAGAYWQPTADCDALFAQLDEIQTELVTELKAFSRGA